MTPPPRRRSLLLRRVHTLVALAVVGILAAVNGPLVVAFAQRTYHNWLINTASYKHQYGHWSIVDVPDRMKVNAVHAILLYTGDVLIMAGSGNSVGAFNAGRFRSILYDPRTNRFKKIDTPTDMFCGGHAILPDGKVLIAGGTTRYEVLHSQIHYAAGVVTVANRSLGSGVTLPAGTTFVSAAGWQYRSIAATYLPPAHWAGVGRARRPVASETPLWVKARTRGDAPALRTLHRFQIIGIGPATGRVLQATAFDITRDEQTFWGSRRTYVFDPATDRYEVLSDLNVARWYPTLVTLADGHVLAVGGLDQFGRIIVGRSEEWDPETRKWSLVARLTRPFPTYPSLFVTKSEKLFFSGANAGFGPHTAGWRTPGIWNPVTNAFQAVRGLRDPTLTETAGSVLEPPAQAQRYALIGGGGVGNSSLSTGRIDVADLSVAHPRYRPAGRLPVPTRYPEVVITPDDKLLISGGSRYYRGEHGSDIFECHLYDPTTGGLRRLADPLEGRDYHAEALLLPDGRILTLGGNPLFGNRQDTAPSYFEQQITIFSPPYLFHGARPRLSGGPAQLRRGETASFTSPDARAIVRARLMHPSAVTHVTDLEQRSIALGLRVVRDRVVVTIPSGAGLVPSGWYMLFALNARGVPSVARWVHIG